MVLFQRNIEFAYSNVSRLFCDCPGPNIGKIKSWLVLGDTQNVVMGALVPAEKIERFNNSSNVSWQVFFTTSAK